MVEPERGVHASGEVAEVVVPSAARSVAVVRRFAVRVCRERGWGQAADTVELLVSEAASNAVLHAGGPEIRVRLVDEGPRLRVEVDDGSPTLPRPRDPYAHAEDGRGLALIDRLALRWGTAVRDGGKTLWFEVGR